MVIVEYCADPRIIQLGDSIVRPAVLPADLAALAQPATPMPRRNPETPEKTDCSLRQPTTNQKPPPIDSFNPSPPRRGTVPRNCHPPAPRHFGQPPRLCRVPPLQCSGESPQEIPPPLLNPLSNAGCRGQNVNQTCQGQPAQEVAACRGVSAMSSQSNSAPVLPARRSPKQTVFALRG